MALGSQALHQFGLTHQLLQSRGQGLGVGGIGQYQCLCAMGQFGTDAAVRQATDHHRQAIGHGLQDHHAVGVLQGGVGQHICGLIGQAQILLRADEQQPLQHPGLFGQGAVSRWRWDVPGDHQLPCVRQ